ncbi:HAD-IA family hydrolase [Saccharothrix obliqua]|uniref:HAD-IA family hydrolase n=1 Tax=Saccharothrix obliqua TaxID=2861747 RepID=UPI001C5FF50C|nr:HAD-IA family hydrolase [Saccharothrix obliqua]MBW4717272.1 HAD-IA family hydrolase [Saccharothrix obliqua]
MNLRCTAVLFDLDGVLVNSEAAIQAMWRRWAVRRGFDPEEVVALTPGRPAVDTIRIVAPELDAPAEALALEPEQIADLASLEPVPGARDLVTSLRAGTWAVVTSGSRLVATTRLDTVGIPKPEVLVTADDVTAGKPAPEGYLSAARLLGVPPGECVVVEDARSGVLAARAAGMRVVGIAGPQLGPVADVELTVPDLGAVRARYEDDGLVLAVDGRVTAV